jgi:peptidoglycan LD-endopeptidase LytH
MRRPRIVVIGLALAVALGSTPASATGSSDRLRAAGEFDPRPRPVTLGPYSVDVVTPLGLTGDKVGAVAVNVTAVDASADLFVTLWPGSQDRPNTSNLNLRAGDTRANLAIVPVDTNGSIAVATGGAYTDILLDLVGWFDRNGTYSSQGSRRLLDTRPTRRVNPGEKVTVATDGACEDATAVNVTAVNAAASGFVTVWPAGDLQPNTSTLNLIAGETAANMSLVVPGPACAIALTSTVTIDLLVDRVGVVSGVDPVRPIRMLDTRTERAKVVPNAERVVQTGAVEGESVAVNVTAVDPDAAGFVTVWPTGTARPNTSNLNTTAGRTTPNMVIVRAGLGGRVSIAASMPTHLLIDHVATLGASSGFHGIPPIRVLDTRVTLPPGGSVRHGFPLPAGTNVGYSPTHANYSATDIFAACGTPILSPVDGMVSHIRRVDSYKPSNPATWGGRSVAVVGDDGVRYYGSHYDTIRTDLVVGMRVQVGTPLGTMGRTGDTTVCHLHFGLSLPCPGPEWSVRRGSIWPWPYLDAWRAGNNLSPQAEILTWKSANPSGCWNAMNGPFAADGE